MKKNQDQILKILEERFKKIPERHSNLAWSEVRKSLLSKPKKLDAIQQMELSGGEPSVVQLSDSNGGLSIVDCSRETPKARVSLCYDDEALNSRKKNKPQGSAFATADSWGVKLLTEAQYLELQEIEAFDLKTSSWLFTPESVRSLGGAIFGDHRYGRAFISHNGAESYFGSRGFRCIYNLGS